MISFSYLKKILPRLLLICLMAGISGTAKSQKTQLLTDFVNPFIGTGGHGHTFPGRQRSIRMVQLSPDTRLNGWDGCSAYHGSDSVIYDSAIHI